MFFLDLEINISMSLASTLLKLFFQKSLEKCGKIIVLREERAENLVIGFHQPHDQCVNQC